MLLKLLEDLEERLEAGPLGMTSSSRDPSEDLLPLINLDCGSSGG